MNTSILNMREKSIVVKGVKGEIRDSSADVTPISTIHNSSLIYASHTVQPSFQNSKEVLTHSYDCGVETDETRVSQGHPNQRTLSHYSPAAPGNQTTDATGPLSIHSSPHIIVQPGNVHRTATFAKVPDYTALSICVLLCLCLPFGLIAYMKASKSRISMFEGNLDVAMLQARESRNWSIAGIVCFVLVTGMVVTIALSYVYIK